MANIRIKDLPEITDPNDIVDGLSVPLDDNTNGTRRALISTLRSAMIEVGLQGAYQAGNQITVTTAEGAVIISATADITDALSITKNHSLGGSPVALRISIGAGGGEGFGANTEGVRIEQTAGGTGVRVPILVRDSSPADVFKVTTGGLVQTAPGTEAAPAHSFLARTGAGLYTPATANTVAINALGFEQQRWSPGGVVEYQKTATAAALSTPRHTVFGGDGVSAPNDDIVAFHRTHDTVNEWIVFYTERARNGGAYTGISTAIQINTPGQTAAINADILLNSGSGAAAYQSLIRNDTAGGLDFRGSGDLIFRANGSLTIILQSSSGRWISGLGLNFSGDGSAGAPLIKRNLTGDGIFWGAGFVAFATTAVECGRFEANRTLRVGPSGSTVNQDADVVLHAGNGTTARSSGLRGYGSGHVSITAEVGGQLRIGAHPGASLIVEWSSTNLVNVLSGSENGPATCPAGNDTTTGFSQLDGSGTLALIASQSARIKLAATAATTRMGTGSGYADIIGRANANITPVGNVSTGEDDLMTYSLPGNSLSANARGVRITARFKLAANGNTKTIKLYFGATIIAQFSKASNNKIVFIEATVMRTGASAQISHSVTTDGASGSAADTAPVLEEDSPAETLSGVITIKATGEATATDDIIQQMMLVEYLG